MSRENVERYRQSIEAWNRGALRRVARRHHPGLGVRLLEVFPGLDPIYRGREGALELRDTMRGLGTTRAFTSRSSGLRTLEKRLSLS